MPVDAPKRVTRGGSFLCSDVYCTSQSKIGKLDKAWDEAITDGWTVVSMKDDWTTIYPPAKQ